MYAYELFRLAWADFIRDTKVIEHFIHNDGQDNLSVRYQTSDNVMHEWSVPMKDLFKAKAADNDV